VNHTKDQKCTMCSGFGKVHTHGGERDPDPYLSKQDIADCPKCNGSGIQPFSWNDVSVLELCKRYPFKPGMLIHWPNEECSVEVVSYPIPNDTNPVTIIVRTIPGDSRTLKEVPADELLKLLNS